MLDSLKIVTFIIHARFIKVEAIFKLLHRIFSEDDEKPECTTPQSNFDLINIQMQPSLHLH